jgi:hypothetical protein
MEKKFWTSKFLRKKIAIKLDLIIFNYICVHLTQNK